MTKIYSKHPCHWRAGRGYMPPGAVPTASPFPPPGLCYGPFPHPVGPSHGFPVRRPAYICTPHPYTVEVKQCLKSKIKPQAKPAPALTATDTDSSASETCSSTADSSDESFASSEVTLVDEPPKKTKIASKKPPTGTRWDVEHLDTGTKCSFHIIDGSKVSLNALTNVCETPTAFRFKIYTAQDNATVTELITALKGGEGSSVTQMWEWGEGHWKKGSTIVKGSEKAGARLTDLGWSGAGSRMRPPIWLYVKLRK